MSAYISEIQYFGDTASEFLEVAVAAGTDVSGYTIQMYASDGFVWNSFSLGTYSGTMDGKDVYLLDDSTPGFSSGDPTGNFYPDDAIAIVDGSGTVLQFSSWMGYTVTANDGAAAGMTSTNIGSALNDDSLQSDDGGITYFSQSSQNPGAIPACYSIGTLIAVPGGAVPVESLKSGDHVCCSDGSLLEVKMLWNGEQSFEGQALDKHPVLIRAGAFGRHKPRRDMLVSGQHRIVVGTGGQLECTFPTPCFVPAKALVGLAGISFFSELENIRWYHVLCERHGVISAEGVLSETMLLGPQIVLGLGAKPRAAIRSELGNSTCDALSEGSYLPSLSVGETRRKLSAHVLMTRPRNLEHTLH